MTAIADIESAIERLAPAKLNELGVWLDQDQEMVNASAEIFSLYEQEKGAGFAIVERRRSV